MSFLPPESPEAAEAARQKDEQYAAKWNIDLAELQESWRNMLWMKPFVDPDEAAAPVDFSDENAGISWDAEEEQAPSEEGGENIEESPYFPIINRLAETNQISSESLEQVIASLEENEGKLDLDTIEGLDEKDKTVIETYIWGVEWEWNDEKNLMEFSKDIKEIEGKDYMQGIDLENSEVLNVIWKNYLKFPDKEWNFDVEADLSTAILSTKTEILKEVKNINTSSETYKVAIKNINSQDISKQMDGIDSLYHLAYANEWKLAKWVIDKYRKKRKAKLLKEAQKLEEKLQAATTQKNLSELAVLEKEKKSIIQEMTELTGIKDGKPVEWDVFTAGEQDTWPEQSESNEKRA